MLTLRHPNQGFTLLELLAVLAIASILSGVGIVGWQGSQRRLAVSAATNQIISMYQATRFQAIRRSTPVAIFLDGDEIVSFAIPPGVSCAAAPRTQPVGSTFNWRESLPPGHTVNWNNGGGAIWQPTGLVGNCDGNGGVANATIEIRDGATSVASLTVFGVSGRISTNGN